MKTVLMGLALSLTLTLIGCGQEKESATKAAPQKPPAADIAAGKAIAEQGCKNCHGLDGKGVGPAIPHLSAQRELYLVASLKEYKEGKRTHMALQDIAAKMTDADMRNIAAYYAGQPPVVVAPATDVKQSSPYEQGKKLAEACVKCHGEGGNATARGTPSLAGQQPLYLVAAIQEYHRGDREKSSMRSMLSDSDRMAVESLALYFSAQTPAQRAAAPRGDAAAGEKLSAMCNGCHGAQGVSHDAATPSLAGQDFDYLVKATKAYWTTRKSWGMQRYVAGLNEKDVDNLAAYYAAQKPRAAESVPSSTQEMAAKCDRCHDEENNPSLVTPKMRGQDKEYLVMAMRKYRDEKREASVMHRMSFPYSNAMIDSIATWYASQPPK
jgi:cytochrome c553